MPKKPTTFVDENGRVCPRCEIYKPWSEFHKAKQGFFGHGSRCKKCINTLNMLSYREYMLKRAYDISCEDYNAMLKSQNGVCAICDLPESVMLHGKVKLLSVDHDHETGRIRGLLCHNCNTLLGNAKDSPAILQSAIDYLKRS